MKYLWYWDATLQCMVCSFAAFGTKVLLCNSGGAAFPYLLSQGAPLQYLQYQHSALQYWGCCFSTFILPGCSFVVLGGTALPHMYIYISLLHL